MEEKIKAIRTMILYVSEDLDGMKQSLRECNGFDIDSIRKIREKKSCYEGIRIGLRLALDELKK